MTRNNPKKTSQKFVPVALTIAGSDPSGGAGIQADLKVFHQHQTYGMSVITLLTVQNTGSVKRVQVMPEGLVLEQLDAVLEDIVPHALKTGALGSPEVIDALYFRLSKTTLPLVIDPVMVSKHGSRLLNTESEEILRRKFVKLAYLVTPNIEEAQVLSERDIYNLETMKKAAQTISLLGPKNVLIKGGHLGMDTEEDITNLLWNKEGNHYIRTPRVKTKNTHGTGCSLSAAITANIAKGLSVLESSKNACNFVYQAILTNPGLGKGFGPINFHAPIN